MTQPTIVYNVVGFYDEYEKSFGDGFFPLWSMEDFTQPFNVDTVGILGIPTIYESTDTLPPLQKSERKANSTGYSSINLSFELNQANQEYYWKQKTVNNRDFIDGFDGNSSRLLLLALNAKLPDSIIKGKYIENIFGKRL